MLRHYYSLLCVLKIYNYICIYIIRNNNNEKIFYFVKTKARYYFIFIIKFNVLKETLTYDQLENINI